MKRLLLLAILVVSTARVHAQPAEGENPPPAGAEPKVQSKIDSAEGKEAGEAEDTDPSRHFNFANFSYSGKDEYGGKYGDGDQVTPDGVKVEAPPFLFLVLNFARLFYLLMKYLWPAGQKVAADRHDQIKNALDEAAKLRAEAQKKLEEYEARIKNVDGEIKKLVDGIRADAQADKNRILEQAAAQAAQMKKDAESRIAAEIELARTQLTKEVTAAAVGATEKLLKDKTTPDDQRKLVQTFIGGVGGPS